MAKIPKTFKIEEDDWKLLQEITGKQTATEIMQDAVQKRIELGLKTKTQISSKTKEELTLDDVNPYKNLDFYPENFIKRFFQRRSKRGITHKENITWVENWGYDREEAEKILTILYNYLRWPPITPEQKKKILQEIGEPVPLEEPIPSESSEPSKTLKKRRYGPYRREELKSGHIEYFHQRYRQFKEQNRMLGRPDLEPQHHVVREWFKQKGIDRRVADRWAMELLEKYIPKNINGGKE